MFLWLLTGYTAGFVATQWWLRLLLIAVAVAVSVHLGKMKAYWPAGWPSDVAQDTED